MKPSVFSLYWNKLVFFLGGSNGENGSKVKEDLFHFDLIEYYFRNKKKSSVNQDINDKTIDDIDFYEVFMYLDRTKSKIGQQYLFNQLLTLNTDDDFKEQEMWIDYCNKNPEEKRRIELILSKLTKKEAYYISNLFIDSYVRKPRWFWIVRILMFLPLLAFLFTFIAKFFYIVLIFLITVNLIVHYLNKKYVFLYKDSILQLLILHRCVKEIITLNLPVKPEKSLLLSIKTIDKLKSKMSVFEFESKTDSDVFAFFFVIFEYIKIVFLLEPVIVFDVLSKLDEKRQDIQNMFEYLGMIDSFISVASIREELPYYCKPDIQRATNVLEFTDIYHPLILNCVPNSLNVNTKSILLTGSNMAGKTTFIRTVAINVLLAQTINTCFAKDFKLSRMRLFSAIRISDDLLSDKSYYFEEVLTIKNMVTESNSLSNNLFLLDEIFKGTNTIERIAAGKAVLSYLAKSENNIVFVSTHDVELTELLNDFYDLYHFTEVIKDGKIHFDYKLKQGHLSTKNAIRILEINNYPKEIIEDACKISNLLQQNNTI